MVFPLIFCVLFILTENDLIVGYCAVIALCLPFYNSMDWCKLQCKEKLFYITYATITI